MTAAHLLVEPNEVARALADLVGVPYLDHGRTREGADCFGVVALAQERLYGLQLPSYLGAYASAEEEREVARAIRTGVRSWRSVAAPEPGDTVLCWAADPAHPSHLGIYLGDQQMLSTRAKTGARIEDLASGFWRHRVVDYLRHETRFDATFEVIVLDARGGVVRRECFPVRTSLRAAIEAMGLGEIEAGYLRVLIGRASYDEPTHWMRLYPRRGTQVVLRHIPADPITIGLVVGWVVANAIYFEIAIAVITLGLGIYQATSVAKGPDPISGIQGPEESPLLNGVGNSMRPYEAIPEHFGDLVFFPDLGGPVWTEFIVEERWATALFVVGVGRYEIPLDEIEIGGIPFQDLTGAEVRIGEGGIFGDYDAETTTEIDPASTANARPISYWPMDSGANQIPGGPALTAQAGALFDVLDPLIQTGRAGFCNGGYFSCPGTLLIDWTQDWTIDLWAKSTFPGVEEALFAVGVTNSIQIIKSPGTGGVYVRIGLKDYGAFSVPRPHDEPVITGFGHWGQGLTSRGAMRGGTSHVLVKYRRVDGHLALQIDNEEFVVVPAGLNLVQPTGAVIIVGALRTLTSRWSGKIDEVVVWQRYLDGSEGGQRTQAGEQGAGATRAPLVFDVYRDTIIETPVNERLDQADSTKFGIDTITPYVARTIRGRPTQLQVDLWFDGLWRRNEFGKRRGAVVALVIEYRPDGSDLFLRAQDAAGFAIIGGGGAKVDPTQGSIVVGSDNYQDGGYVQDSFMLSFRWDVPEAEEYEIRMLRFEPTAYDGAKFNNRQGGDDFGGGVTAFTILAYRGLRAGVPPLNVDGLATFALRVPLRAVGDQLGRVSCRARRLLPIYDPADPEAGLDGFTPPRLTRNASWAAVQILRGGPRSIDDDLINLPEMADFATRARNFDYRFDSFVNKFDAFNDAVKMSRASLDLDSDGRFTVAEDRAVAVPAALLTQRNQRNFRGTKSFYDRPHAMRVDWWDERGNKNQLTVYADGFSERGDDGYTPELAGTQAATRFESSEVRGLITESEVWDEIRVRMRMTQFRDEEWRSEVPLEAFPLRRGMRLQEQHPAMLVGRKSGTCIRVVTSGANAIAIRLDEKILYNAGETYGIRWRDPQNNQHITTVANPATTEPIEGDVLAFTTPIAIASAPHVEDLVAFGLVGTVTAPSMIREINFIDEWSAEVVRFPYHDDIYLPADVPVDLDPIVTHRPQEPHAKAPAIPGIALIESDERFLIRVGTAVLTRARVLVQSPPNSREPAAYFQLRWRIGRKPGIAGVVHDTGWHYGDPFSADSATTFATDLEDGLVYEFQARAYSVAGVTSIFSGSVTHLVIGKKDPPPNVTDLRVEGQMLVWTYPGFDEIIDLDGFKLRYRHGNTLPVLWGRGNDAHRGVLKATTFPLDSLPRDNRALTVMLKAVDVAGHESVEAAILILGPGALSAQRNVTLNSEESVLGWPGEKVDCSVVGGVLTADVVEIDFAWKKRVVSGDRTNVAGTFTLDPDNVVVQRVILTGGPATTDDARGGYYFWFNADGADAATRIADKLTATEFMLSEPYRGAASTGAGTIHRAAYAIDDLAGAWDPDHTQLAWADRYRAMQYTATLHPDGFDLGDVIKLEVGVTPDSQPYLIEYAVQGSVPAWSADRHTPAWTNVDSTPAWSGFGPWRPWPGHLAPDRRVSYHFRVSFREVRAVVPPTLDYMTIIGDVPDRTENLNDVSISAAGTRLWVTTPFRFIRNVYVTLQESGTTAVTFKVIDKNPAGPLVEVYDAAGTRVAGSIDAQLIGA